MYRRGKHIQF